MGRTGFRIIAVLACVLGAFLMYSFALGNTDGRLIDVPGYVKVFFAVFGFMVVGAGTAFWKIGNSR